MSNWSCRSRHVEGSFRPARLDDGRLREETGRARSLSDIEAAIPHLRRYARVLAVDTDRADDLVERVLEEAPRAIDRRQTKEDLRLWLFGLLRSHYHMLRAERVDVSCARSRQERAAATADGHAGDVNRAFFDLDEIHRETLLLLLIEQLPKEKTARLMDVSVATMNVRLMQARNALKYALAVNNKSLAYKANH